MNTKEIANAVATVVLHGCQVAGLSLEENSAAETVLNGLLEAHDEHNFKRSEK